MSEIRQGEQVTDCDHVEKSDEKFKKSDEKTVKPNNCMSESYNIGLCYRCEHRAEYLERGHAPKVECKDIENSKYICYSYKPVKPCVLAYPDFGGTDYDKLNKNRSPIGGYMGARMECVGLADVELEANEEDGNWIFTWILK